MKKLVMAALAAASLAVPAVAAEMSDRDNPNSPFDWNDERGWNTGPLPPGTTPVPPPAFPVNKLVMRNLGAKWDRIEGQEGPDCFPKGLCRDVITAIPINEITADKGIRMTATIDNNSNVPVRDVQMEVVMKDCSWFGNCRIVGKINDRTDANQITFYGEIPPHETRTIETGPYSFKNLTD
jgi:hypothetical protein